jgi:UDPglucose--hexose-1-phosphate uridylyltransferase
MVRVVAASPPLFHVEGDFRKQAAGVCDRMESIGAHEVVVESPNHDDDFENLDDAQVYRVLDVLRMRASDLGKDERLRQALMFRVSATATDRQTHPRWHVVATPFVPAVIKQELNGARSYFGYKERCAVCDYVRDETRQKVRVIADDTHAIALAPYAARFPYEVWVIPFRHSPDFRTIISDEIASLGRLLRQLVGALKQLPESRGYVLSIHTAPYRKPKPGSWETIGLDYHWHIQIRPRMDLLNGLKESGGFHLNPITPEDAAKVISDLGK